MIVLGLDTATRVTAVAVLDTTTGETIERHDDPPAGERPGHMTRLLGFAHDALESLGGGWGDVGLIAVGLGPGTFTGLRIGVVSARALAAAREIPIVGISSLRAVAYGAAAEAEAEGRDVLAVLDARRREVFAAGWGAADLRAPDAGTAAPRLRPQALAPAGLADGLTQERGSWLAVGDGAVQARGVLERAEALIPADGSVLHVVSALAHCRLAAGLGPVGPVAGPPEIEPDYLREPDAELTRRAAAAR